MKTSAYLSSDLLSEYGIDSVVVEFYVERVPKESYHMAGQITEIVEVVPEDGCIHPREKLDELALQKGHDNPHMFLFEMFDHELNEVAMADGPGIEADSYVDYHSERGEPDWNCTL